MKLCQYKMEYDWLIRDTLIYRMNEQILKNEF